MYAIQKYLESSSVTLMIDRGKLTASASTEVCMKKFDVEITETLQRTVSVEAASQEEAEKIVTKAWNNEDYVLDSADFVGVDFKTVGEQELSESRKMEVLLVNPVCIRRKPPSARN